MSRFTASAVRLIAAPHPDFSLWGWLSSMRVAYRSRQQLAQLDADQLRDVGISEKAAKAEASRPVWDVPQHWMQ